MEPPGDFVGDFVKLAAGMQLSQNNLRGRFLFGRMHVNRNAAAVVNDRHTVIDMDADVDLVAVTYQSLIDGVIHNLVDQVVQPSLGGVANIHSGSFSHRLEAFENFNIIGFIVGLGWSFCLRHFLLLVGFRFACKV